MTTMAEILDELDPIEKDVLQDVLDEYAGLSDDETEEEIAAVLGGEEILEGELVEGFAHYIVHDLNRKL